MVQAQPVGGDELVGPLADLRGAGRGVQVAVGPEPRVDALLVAERADLGDALLARAAPAQRRFFAEAFGQPRELSQERVHKPAVATARSTAADVLLEQDHIDTGIEFL